MSWQKKDKLDSSLFLTGKPVLDNLEYPVNFDKMMKPNTVETITKWMFESNRELKIPDEYYGLLASEGGSNAIGYIQEFEVVGPVADAGGGRSNNQDFVICFSHQNERSGGWSSDTSGFVDKPNEDLGLLLKKNHAVQQ